jgi:hypothetical protein
MQREQPRPIHEIVVADMVANRGEPWITGTVNIYFEGLSEDTSGPEVSVSIGAPWDRTTDTFDGVRLRLVERAFQFLGYAAALQPPDIESLLEKGLQELPATDWSNVIQEPVVTERA